MRIEVEEETLAYIDTYRKNYGRGISRKEALRMMISGMFHPPTHETLKQYGLLCDDDGSRAAARSPGIEVRKK
jgi:Fe-S cluster assembly scaffold protein SufB